MTDEREILANLPLTQATFYILLSLLPMPKHGYAVMKEVKALSDGRILLSTGTLYGAIKRLLGRGWIERIDDLNVEETGRGRKSYKLTHYGRRILNAEIDRLQSLVKTARQISAEGRP